MTKNQLEMSRALSQAIDGLLIPSGTYVYLCLKVKKCPFESSLTVGSGAAPADDDQDTRCKARRWMRLKLASYVLYLLNT